MTTITPHSGNRKSNSGEAPGSFGPPQGEPGTLTAVPHADQYRTAPPRPEQARPTPLGDLAAHLGVDAPGTAEISGITHDSRAVRPGDVYAALPGARAHGADFVAQAAGLGAAAILTDPAGAERAAATGLPVLVVENPRGRMGELAAEIYGRPGVDLLQIGITGTSGKTTTAYLVEGGLRGAGHSTGLVGTVEMRIGDERIKSERTTPRPPTSRRSSPSCASGASTPSPWRFPATPSCSAGSTAASSTSPSSTTSARSTWSSTPTWTTTTGRRPGSSRPSAAASAWSTSTTRTAAGSPERRPSRSSPSPPRAAPRPTGVPRTSSSAPTTRRSPPSAPRASGSTPPPRCPARSTSPTPSPRSPPSPPRASTPRAPPRASPPSPASPAAWSGSRPASRTSPSSTTRTRRTPSNRSCAPCARSPRASCTWSSAAAATGTPPSAARWAPPRPGSPTPPS